MVYFCTSWIYKNLQMLIPYIDEQIAKQSNNYAPLIKKFAVCVTQNLFALSAWTLNAFRHNLDPDQIKALVASIQVEDYSDDEAPPARPPLNAAKARASGKSP